MSTSRVPRVRVPRGRRLTWNQRPRIRPLAAPPRMSRRARRLLMAIAALTLTALVVAAVAWTQAYRQSPRPTGADRADLERAATSAVTALMTFGGEHPPAPDAVRAHLSDPLLTRYDAERADLVLPDAVAASAQMTVNVVGMAVGEFHADDARLLTFLNQTVTVPDASAPGAGAGVGGEHTSTEKWLVMRKVNGTWLLADVRPVGDVTR
ncbi:hypothetical protein [Gordonia polyisoprenivorans]|nr:hypothetical protein [Gordonia polyisoprenivorans]